MVITELDAGGAEKAFVSLATRLDRSRWAPSVVCLGPEAPLAGSLRHAGLPVTCLDVHRRRPIRAVLRLANVLRAIRPELIQSFLFHANLATKLAAPMAGRPWVVGGVRVAEREKTWHLRSDRLTQRLSAGSICVSKGVKTFSMGEGGIGEDRLLVIPNGIDPIHIDLASPIEKSKLGLSDGSRVILFVGRITLQKGVTLLLQAFEEAAKRHPEWHLVIVGDGPERPDLQAQTEADPNLRGRVNWLGRRDDVPALMKMADLFVLPSIWEGMPNVVLEAMAARLPVLAARVEGIEELVSTDNEARSGWYFRPGETDDLLAAMAELERFPQFGKNGRARVDRDFRMETVVASYEHVWAALLGLERDSLPKPPNDLPDFGIKPDGPHGR
ncbi:MAG: family glycosyltransferase [Planctomycetota bacterium]|nr:family glycosyltransferase [Planctomycetota bacterium]